jgi:hypothetical protein
LLDSRVYEVTFSNGHIREYRTNVIVENIFATVDDDGYETKIFKDILDHRSNPNTVLNEDESWVISQNGNRVPKHTTIGWDLCVEWRDGSTDWIPLK